MLSVKVFTFNQFQQNTSVVYCDETLEAAIIDPGCYTKAEQTQLTDFIKKLNLKVVRLINTHCHVDHVLGNSFVKRMYNVKLGIHQLDASTLKAVEVYAGSYGFPEYEPSEADYFLNHDEIIKLGNSELKVVFVPGHAPGHVVFYAIPEKFIIGGDTLFNNGIGRTDLPGGDFDTLIQSIKAQLFTLPKDVIVYPGHGPKTSIGYELEHNYWS
jgi:glyoxylase-like metal-dependent hydrolase (beta-lactamase superfamily II)